MRLLILLLLAVSLSAESVPPAARAALKAQGDLIVAQKREIAAGHMVVVGDSPAGVAARKLEIAITEAVADYFEVPAHQELLKGKTDEINKVNGQIAILRQRLAQKLPAFALNDSNSAFDLCCHYGQLKHINWMRKLCDGSYKGP